MSRQMEDIKNIMDKTTSHLSKEQLIEVLEKEIDDMKIEVKRSYPNALFDEDNVLNATVTKEWLEEYTKKIERLSALKAEA